MHGYIKVRAASPRVCLANPAENAKSVVAAMRGAEAAGVQVLVLPELFLSGCTCGDLFRQEVLIKSCDDALNEILRRTADTRVLCAVGIPVRTGGGLYNCAAVIQSGSLLGTVQKRNLSYSERRWFTDGGADGEEFFELGTASVAVAIGALRPQGARLILRLSAEPALAGSHAKRMEQLRQYSGQNNCCVVSANAGAGESTSDMVFSGDCAIAFGGEIISAGERFSQNGASCEASIDVSKSAPVAVPDLAEAPEEHKLTPYPFVPENAEKRAGRCAEILEIQAAGLAQRLRHTGSKRLVLGLSGGQDSTLALLVCLKACEALERSAGDVLCVSMPGFGTTKRTKNNAKSLAEAVGAEYREIDITAACEQHMRDIGHDMSACDTTYENIQARERTQILMDVANMCGGLVVGTGDLSELALGWCTYNGDHMSMYGVNAGVPKTLIRHILANVQCTNYNVQMAEVLRDILDTPVSPELLPPDEAGEIAQKTEEILGDYAVHDFYLYHFLRHGTAPARLLSMATRAFEGVYAEAALKKWLDVFLRRFFSQQFKRSCLPEGVKVGSVSLSPRGDWLMPGDAGPGAWAEAILRY